MIHANSQWSRFCFKNCYKFLVLFCCLLIFFFNDQEQWYVKGTTGCPARGALECNLKNRRRPKGEEASSSKKSREDSQDTKDVDAAQYGLYLFCQVLILKVLILYSCTSMYADNQLAVLVILICIFITSYIFICHIRNL